MDAVEDISQIGQRIEAVELGGLDDGHSARQSFRTGIGACEEPVLAIMEASA